MVHFYTYLRVYLGDFNKFFSLGDFEKLFKIPHQTIKRSLSILVKKKVLIEEKKGKFLFYTLNINNPLSYEYLSICEKEKTFDFLENKLFYLLYEKLFPFFLNKSFVIFGSAANSKSFNDIDLLVFEKSKDSMIETVIHDFESEYSIKVHVIETDEKNIKGGFIHEVKKNHIILNNHDYFVRLFSKS
jgi:predicted nucleotidyltransferase